MTAGARRLRHGLQRILQPPHTVEDANIRLLYREIAWYGIANAVAITFTSVFAIRLGASNQLLGLLASLPALVGIVWQMPAARLVERHPHQRQLIVIHSLLHRLGFLAVAILPWVISSGRPQVLVGITTLMAVPLTVANIAFTALIGDVVPPGRRARVVSLRNALLALSTTVAVLAIGRLLDAFPFPINYQGTFLVAFLASMLSLADLARLRPPAEEAAQAPAPREPVSWRSVLGHQRFRGFAIATLAVNLGIYAPSALYALYKVRTLHASDTWIGLLGTAETAVSVFSAYYWGRQTARRGNRQVLLISCLGMSLYPLLTGLSPRVEPLLVVSFISGLFAPAYNIALFNLLLEESPVQGRPTYIGIYNVLLNVAAFVGPLFGTALADWLDIRAALLICAAVRVAAAGVFAWWIRADLRLGARLSARPS